MASTDLSFAVRERPLLPSIAGLLLGLLSTLLPPVVASAAAATAHDAIVDLTFPSVPSKTTMGDWYDAARSGGRVHMATDIMGAKLLPIHAAMGGVVTRISTTAAGTAGYSVTIKGDDGRTYSYLHLNNDSPATDDGQGTPAQAYAPGVELNGRVERGQHIAYMGDSGNAEATQAHLHFSISDAAITDPYGTHYLDPYPSLKAAIARGDVPTPPATAVPAADPRETPPAAPDLSVLCSNTDTSPVFSDVGSDSVHGLAVSCLAGLSVTFGTSDGRYSPANDVTRLQMASFTARLLEAGGVVLPQAPADAFDDDDGSVHELAVNQLVGLEVIRWDTGEVGRDFEGEVAMKRDRMAAWMVRASALISGGELPAAPTDYFGDDAALHHGDINRLAAVGIVQGTSPGLYSPRAAVRRDQMASYLARTLAAATR